MKAALFPGQGSQSVGMGQKLYDNSEVAKDIFETANKILGYDIKNLMLNGPIEELTSTENAQPALLTSSYAYYKHFTSQGNSVDAAAGHSLGEYSALVAAEVISFEDAVLLVNKRGKYMQEAVPKGAGGMLAVMGLSEDEILDLCSKVTQGVVEIANLNCPGQTVVAGDKVGLAEFQDIASGSKIIPLNVSAPFHCSLMKQAADNLAKDLDAITFSEPKIKVVANVTAKEITSADESRELLKQQVCSSVRWTDSINYLVNNLSVNETIEFGPGGVLTKLCKRINKEIKREQFDDRVFG